MQLIFHHSFPYDFDRFCCVLAEIVTSHFSTHCLGTGKNSLPVCPFSTEPCHCKNCFIHDHTCTINKNIIYYISVSNSSILNIECILKTLLYSKMMYTCSPCYEWFKYTCSHVHVLSCAGPPRTVQVEICRQLTKREYPVF